MTKRLTFNINITASPEALAALDRIEARLAELAPDAPETDDSPKPWPFKPGDVVDDADGAVAEWLAEAPAQTVVADVVGERWRRGRSVWWHRLRTAAQRVDSNVLAQDGPLTVVSVPEGA